MTISRSDPPCGSQIKKMRFHNILGCFSAGIMAIGLLCPARGATQQELLDMAMRLKGEKVQRTARICTALDSRPQVCRDYLEAIHQRELKAIGVISLFARDNAEFNKEFAFCQGAPDYDAFAFCLEGLAERLQDAQNGQRLPGP